MSDIQIILLTLLFSAFFSGIEIAFVSANRLRLEIDLKRNLLPAGILNKFYKNPSRFIGAMLLGNNIALVVYGMAMANLLEPVLIRNFPDFMASNINLILTQTIVATLLILVFAEFLPKILFRINPNATLSFFAVPLWIFYHLLFPFIWIYTGISELILRVFTGLKIKHDTYKFSAVDLDNYLRDLAADEAQTNTELDPDLQILQNAIEFRHIRVRDCMIPRPEIEAISSDSSVDELLAKFTETKHSKILVYEESVDNITGYVHSYDMFTRPESIRQVMRNIEVVPETYPASRLLSRFIQNRQGIAVVVDEFGGTAGIVSMEDIIEEIFGEIDDEYDEEETIEEQLGSNSWIFSARLEIEYLNETYKLDIPESDEYETLAGFIISRHENIPAPGEKIQIDKFKITILKSTGNKLEEVRLEVEE
ncbi:MAG: HlyC/CorC family transporter [Bacteroidetes bacterium]|nr:HlyC/CorC family transporter [Bacteroidota bacterium]